MFNPRFRHVLFDVYFMFFLVAGGTMAGAYTFKLFTSSTCRAPNNPVNLWYLSKPPK